MNWDSIVAALQVRPAVQHSGKTLTELKQGINKYPQHMANILSAVSSQVFLQ